MKVTFEPSVCKPQKVDETGKEIAAEYAGTVTIRMPTYDERLGFYEGVDMGDSTEKTGIAFMRAIARQVPRFIEEVAIKRLDDGFEFKSFDDLNIDSDMVPVITEIATKLVGKHRAGVSSST